MNEERWQQVNDIFHTALEHDPGSRGTYLQTATAGDPELLQEVQTLLTTHLKDPGFLGQPAWEVAPDLAYGDDGSLVGKHHRQLSRHRRNRARRNGRGVCGGR